MEPHLPIAGTLTVHLNYYGYVNVTTAEGRWIDVEAWIQTSCRCRNSPGKACGEGLKTRDAPGRGVSITTIEEGPSYLTSFAVPLWMARLINSWNAFSALAEAASCWRPSSSCFRPRASCWRPSASCCRPSSSI